MRKMTMISNTMILMKMIDAWYSIIISFYKAHLIDNKGLNPKKRWF